jgi:hypothetical protein
VGGRGGGQWRTPHAHTLPASDPPNPPTHMHTHCSIPPLTSPHRLIPPPHSPPAVDSYVEMFRVHGDIHSFLYTGSPAMHSHVLSLVVQVRVGEGGGGGLCGGWRGRGLSEHGVLSVLWHVAVACHWEHAAAPLPMRSCFACRGARATAPRAGWASCRTCGWRCSGGGTTR